MSSMSAGDMSYDFAGKGYVWDEIIFATYAAKDIPANSFSSMMSEFAGYYTGQANTPEQFGFSYHPGGGSGCIIWDCYGISLDVASLGGQALRTSGYASTPLTGPGGLTVGSVGQGIATGATYAGHAYTLANYASGNASKADLVVNIVSTYGQYVPVVGESTGVFQLLWDIADPIIPDD